MKNDKSRFLQSLIIFALCVLRLPGTATGDVATGGSTAPRAHIHLVTSHFSNHQRHLHYDEVESAIAANALNPVITALHVIYEGSNGGISDDNDDCTALRRRLQRRVSLHWSSSRNGTAVLAEKLNCVAHTNRGRATFQELLAIYPHRIYEQLLQQQQQMSEKPHPPIMMVLHNADVVMDESLQRLSTIRRGHVALLTVNTGPDMINCCLDGRFQTLLEHERAASQSSAFSCAGDGGNSSKECASTLVDSDQAPHVLALQRFFVSATQYSSPVSSSSASNLNCPMKHWSTNGFQFCGNPIYAKNAEPRSSTRVQSWDAFAFLMPLPKGLRAVGNPWFGNMAAGEAIGWGYGGASGHINVNMRAEIKALAAGADRDAERSVFTSPLVMNYQGAENRVACALRSNGLNLYAPCKFVRLAHWHCTPKTHHGKQRADRPPQLKLVNDLLAILKENANLTSEQIKRRPVVSYGTPTDCGEAVLFDTANQCTVELGCGGIDISPKI